MVVVFRQDYDVDRESVVIISNDLKHDGSAVYSFMQVLSKHLVESHPSISTIHVWSDGCCAQYKSYFPLYNIGRNFDIPQQVVWNFFGSRHGKGESDGESAVVKNYLDRATHAQQLVLNDSRDCYSALIGSDRLIKTGKSRRVFFHVDPEVADHTRAWLKDQNLCKFPGVRSVHQASKSTNQPAVTYRLASCYCLPAECRHDPANTPKVFVYPG